MRKYRCGIQGILRDGDQNAVRLAADHRIEDHSCALACTVRDEYVVNVRWLTYTSEIWMHEKVFTLFRKRYYISTRLSGNEVSNLLANVRIALGI